MYNVRLILKNVMSHPRPVKFFLALVLMKTGLCTLFTIRRSGYRLRFYPSSLSAAYWLSPRERLQDEWFFASYLRPGDTVIDAGANIGALSIVAALNAGPEGKVYAVEAHPKIFGYLLGNLELNGLTNVEARNCALGAADGRAFFSDGLSDDQNRVAREGIAVGASRLDSLHVRPGEIALLKIDVEGYEKFVIDGGPEVLGRTQCVYFESWERHFAHFGYRAGDLIAALSAHGFTIFRLGDGKTLVPVQPGHESEECENLLAVKDLAFFQSRTGFSPADPAPALTAQGFTARGHAGQAAVPAACPVSN